MRDIKQYLDNVDGKWHITMIVTVPSVSIRNRLNFRVKSIVMTDDKKISDPVLNDSLYVFNIPTKFLGRDIFFNASFSREVIKDIKSICFGFCDEKIRWHNVYDVLMAHNNEVYDKQFAAIEVLSSEQGIVHKELEYDDPNDNTLFKIEEVISAVSEINAAISIDENGALNHNNSIAVPDAVVDNDPKTKITQYQKKQKRSKL